MSRLGDCLLNPSFSHIGLLLKSEIPSSGICFLQIRHLHSINTHMSWEMQRIKLVSAQLERIYLGFPSELGNWPQHLGARERRWEYFYRAEEWVTHQKLGQCLVLLPGGSQRPWEAREGGGWEANGTLERGKLWAAANKEVRRHQGLLRTNLPHSFPYPGSVHVSLCKTSTVPPCSMSTWVQKGKGAGWGGGRIALY